MPSGVQHTLVTLVWTYYWQPYVFPSARTTLDCLCYLYNVCSLIDAALKLCFEKEDGLVLQPYNLKLACLGFFPWQYHEFQQTCLSILCPFFPLSFPHLLYSSAQKGKTGESEFDCYQTQTIKQLFADRLQSFLCAGPEVHPPFLGCAPDGWQNVVPPLSLVHWRGGGLEYKPEGRYITAPVFFREKKPLDVFQASAWRSSSALLSGSRRSFSTPEFLGVPLLRSTGRGSCLGRTCRLSWPAVNRAWSKVKWESFC